MHLFPEKIINADKREAGLCDAFCHGQYFSTIYTILCCLCTVMDHLAFCFIYQREEKKTLKNPVIKMLKALNDILDMQEEHCTVCFCEYVCIFYNPEFL